MITHRGKQIIGVRYDLVYEGKVLDTHDTQGSGRISELIQKVENNPGMSIVAEVYREPDYEADDEIVVSRRQVYPVPSAA